jgi:hypothetical protein
MKLDFGDHAFCQNHVLLKATVVVMDVLVSLKIALLVAVVVGRK